MKCQSIIIQMDALILAYMPNNMSRPYLFAIFLEFLVLEMYLPIQDAFYEVLDFYAVVPSHFTPNEIANILCLGQVLEEKKHLFSLKVFLMDVYLKDSNVSILELSSFKFDQLIRCQSISCCQLPSRIGQINGLLYQVWEWSSGDL